MALDWRRKKYLEGGREGVTRGNVRGDRKKRGDRGKGAGNEEKTRVRVRREQKGGRKRSEGTGKIEFVKFPKGR